jgi:hypothetical protein
MSSTNRGAERAEADNYPTPAWCVDRLLDRIGSALPGGQWLEAAAGDGNIIRAVNERGLGVTWDAVELRSCCHEPLVKLLDDDHVWAGQDFLPFADTYGGNGYQVCITNPPYSLACAFVERCLLLARIVAMPLRLNFLASKERVDWWKRVGIPNLYVLPNRPDFSGGGGDSCEYAWFVWDRGEPNVLGRGRVEVLDLTPKSIRMAQKPAGSKRTRKAAETATPPVEGWVR